ncbi:MAG: NAD(P)-dependent oxidoreductase [Desulfuromonadales bacterium]|nr:NAD(P)-dependent oxidoreductase [Desulfuromonadales bacterium]MBN2792238.1 NAD(P)-dependent oxidoreductase [Desulfuromonadales bacterium]
MSDLHGKTLFITGASRGIGLAVALKAAADGANIIIAAKTASAHPSLPGTIYSAAEQIEAAGGQALPLVVDIRDEQRIAEAVAEGVDRFGGIDILVNNASAIFLAGVMATPVKRFDLMNQVNVRGTFLVSQACLPHLLKADNPHILTFSPPLNLQPHWFKNHTAYTMAKYGMSMTVIGLAAEFSDQGIAVNALWPKTVIQTAALEMLGGLVKAEQCRKPDIMADAAYALMCRDSRQYSGQFYIDEDVLREEGISDFSHYANDPDAPLYPDLFIDDFSL